MTGPSALATAPTRSSNASELRRDRSPGLPARPDLLQDPGVRDLLLRRDEDVRGQPDEFIGEVAAESDGRGITTADLTRESQLYRRSRQSSLRPGCRHAALQVGTPAPD